MDAFRLDLRYALRSLLHRPGFSALAIMTLAIGIGANTVAFSALNALLFKPFTMEGADELGWIMSRTPGNPHGATSWPDYQEFARANRTFEGIAAEGRTPVSLRGTGSGAEQAWALAVSSNYLTVLRARPEIGRVFTAADLRGSELPAVASHRFWTSRLGGGGTVAGRSIVVNGQSVSIVGVLRDDFQGPGGLYEPDLWLPLERIDVLNLPPVMLTRERPWLTVIGRLREGVTPPQGEADLRGIAAQLAASFPETGKDRMMVFVPMTEGHPELRGIARFAWIGLAIVGVVLVIACFNVAGLLLARASERQREIGVRAALGASRGRVLRQLVTEGALLAALSGAAALIVSAWSADLLSAFSLPSPIPQRLHIGIDGRLVGFTAILVLIAGVLPALLPGLQATRADLVRSLKMEAALGGRPSRTRNIFVIAQVTGSTIFLAAALLFVRSFYNSATFDPGFDTAHSLVLELKPSDYGYDEARSRVLFENLVERVRAVPGVQAAGVADRAPFYVGFAKSSKVSSSSTECTTVQCQSTIVYGVGTGHFAALGIPITAGRDFTEQEIRSGTGVIVSAAMASRHWPGKSGVGEWIRETSSGVQRQVIGVAADITHRTFTEPRLAYMYRPLTPGEFGDTVTVVARTTGDPRLLLGAVQAQVHALDPDIPASSAKTMEQRMELPLWPARTAAGFFAICGSLALVLASVGLFGVIYFAVNQRTREFGIRAALGATPRAVVAQVMREGLLLTLPGVLLGLAGAFVAGHLLARGLFGVSPAEPSTYLATALLQALVTLGACALPARRATRADPMIALRDA